jgi:hypothetical protein
MAARALNAFGRCEDCGADFSAVVGLYHCGYGCEEPAEAGPCDHCGERNAVDGLLCEECIETEEAVKQLAEAIAAVTKRSYCAAGRDGLPAHDDTISSAILELNLIRGRYQAREEAAFQMAAE